MTIENQQRSEAVSDKLHRVDLEVEVRGEDDEKPDEEASASDQLRDGSE